MNKKKTAELRDSLEHLTQISEFFMICPSYSCSEHPYKIQQDTGMLHSRWITSVSIRSPTPCSSSHKTHLPTALKSHPFKGKKSYIGLKPRIIQLRQGARSAMNAPRNGAPPNIPHGTIIQELEKHTGSLFWEGPQGNFHLPSSACLLPHLPLFQSHFSNLRETAQIKGAGILCITGRELNLFHMQRESKMQTFHSKPAPAQLHLTSK